MKIPTGYLFTDKYSKGELETLTIGDYGKRHNVKADFLGLTNHINGVQNLDCMSLSEKWVITFSSQYFCIQSCRFCSAPNGKFLGNATFNDMLQQFKNARNLFPNVTYTDRLNVHAARCGEPAFNPAALDLFEYFQNYKKELQDELNLRIEVLHPVFTTSLPNYLKQLPARLHRMIDIKKFVVS